ncbi:MAG: CotH kinase family protein [Calditrichia bacterium]
MHSPSPNFAFVAIVSLLFQLNLTAQVSFSSSNLPIVVIDTNGQDIVDDPKIDAMMGIIDNGNGTRNNLGDPFNDYDGHIGIEIRGSSSQSFPKKQYGFETRDELGENNNVSLLGMPEENDWILYAPYSDKSLLRNVLAYYLSNKMGHYATRTRFCEVVINGFYVGVYVLMEKIKRDDGRVDIKKLDENDISGDDLTGGYILKVDKTTGSGGDGFTSPYPPYPGAWQEITYQYHHPGGDDLLNVQKNYIRDFILGFEGRMFAPEFNTPFDGYYDLVDMDALVDYFLLNEYSKNVDGYRISSFLYKDRDSVDGSLVVGPAWDYNLGFGNADYYSGANPEGWQLLVSINNDGSQVPFWWKRLLQDPIFMNRARCRFQSLRNGLMHPDSIATWVDGYAALLDESRQRNFQRWQILGQYVWPNAFVGNTYQEELDYFKNWISNRHSWMWTALSPPCVDIAWESGQNFDALSNSMSIPLSSIFSSSTGEDSIRFVSEDNHLLFQLGEDSLQITGPAAGEFRFKAIAYLVGTALDYSPAHVFRTGITGLEPSTVKAKSFALAQNYPNPFNGVTRIPFRLYKPAQVKLEVFTLDGVKVAILQNQFMNAGNHESVWTGTTVKGQAAASGIYLYRLTLQQSGKSFSESKKLLYIK